MVGTDDAAVVMDAAALEAFVDAEFPQARALGYRIDRIDSRGAVLRLPVADRHLRPGGTISGPTLVTLADIAMYLGLLSRIGPVPLAVTTDLTVHFLRRPGPRDVIADARLLKLGARLAVGEVHIYSEGADDAIAHAVLTYSIPPRAGR